MSDYVDDEDRLLDALHIQMKNRDVGCEYCERLIGNGYSCEAFPDGIPDWIRSGKVRHDKKVRGDGGLLFKKKAVN